MVNFYDVNGLLEKSIDLDARGEFTVAACNPTGDTVIIGNWHSFHVCVLKKPQRSWVVASVTTIGNLYAVTAISWKNDGSRLAISSLFGSIDLYDACVRRYSYKGKFDFTYSSLSQVVVRQLDTGARIVLKSSFGSEIEKINIFQDRFVVGNAVNSVSSSETMLLGDLASFELSEVPWENFGGEKFVFDNPSCCAVHRTGELTLIEYGSNEILAQVRTDFVSGHLISLRCYKHPSTQRSSKTFAYLLDAHTIHILYITSGIATTVVHDSKIDWLELNDQATMLLFRDRRHQLSLFCLATQLHVTMLNYCTYVQWVPNADVVVAQSRENLCVWYNINNPDEVTVLRIQGEVEGIERVAGRTEVMVNEGSSAASYALDEALIQFSASMELGAFSQSANILELLEVSRETEGLWKKLKVNSIQSNELRIAERCAAALGDVALSRYLRKARKMSTQSDTSTNCFVTSAKLILLSKNDNDAQEVLLRQGNSITSIRMHQQLLNFEPAILLAGRDSRFASAALKQIHFKYLADTQQLLQAARLNTTQGDHKKSVEVNLKGGAPSTAARIAKKHGLWRVSDLIEDVLVALSSLLLYECLGDILEQMGEMQRALDAYIRCSMFGRAVELARKSFPERVVELQGLWGEHLVEEGYCEMAINHFIEASHSAKAIQAAISSRMWSRAATLIPNLDAGVAQPLFLHLAKHHEDAGDTAEAELCFARAGSPNLAVGMYTRNHLWEDAHRIASLYMDSQEANQLSLAHARRLEARGKLKDAEVLYLSVQEPDLAINMYKRHRKFSEMISMVNKHRAGLLKETHQYLAQRLESEGNVRDAEHHYCEAGEWLSAINVYRTTNMWQDAMRVATASGDAAASKRVAYTWAMSLNGESSAISQLEQGLIEQAVEYAMDSGAFPHAFELARSVLPEKIADVHLKYALYLEDEERFKEAEVEFLKAKKPREAIDMYIHQHLWSDALAVAAIHDSNATSDIHLAHGRILVENGNHKQAEELFLLAEKPECALTMYRDAKMWPEALSFSEKHLPQLLEDTSIACTRAGGSQDQVKIADFVATGKYFEKLGHWEQALAAYLNMGSESPCDASQLEEAWIAAVSLAHRKFSASRAESVLIDIVGRLRKIGRYDSAAELCQDNNFVEMAVECAVEGGNWAKAKELAVGHKALEMKISAACEKNLRTSSDLHSLLKHGYKNSAFDVLIEQNDWVQLWDLARREMLPQTMCAEYAGIQASRILALGFKAEDAVQTLNCHGSPPFDSHSRLYEDLVKTTLGQSREYEKTNMNGYIDLISQLKQILWSVSCKENSEHLKGLRMATHFYHTYLVCVNEGLKDIATQVALSLLHYSNIIPADKAFYLAGKMTKDGGNTDLAFALFNRYIDLTEAIEEGSAERIDNTDFAQAHRVPYPLDIPQKQYIEDNHEREDVRDWILSTCVDKRVEQQLPSKDEIKDALYLTLYSSDLPRCVVTGYPVQPWERVASVDFIAKKADWNRFVRKTNMCPWTGKEQKPVY